MLISEVATRSCGRHDGRCSRWTMLALDGRGAGDGLSSYPQPRQALAPRWLQAGAGARASMYLARCYMLFSSVAYTLDSVPMI